MPRNGWYVVVTAMERSGVNKKVARKIQYSRILENVRIWCFYSKRDGPLVHGGLVSLDDYKITVLIIFFHMYSCWLAIRS